MYSTQDIIMVGGALILATLVQGYGGFGYGIVAMALLAFLPFQMLDMAITVSIVALIVMGLLLVVSRKDGEVHWRDAILIIIGTCVGQPIGYWFIVTFGNQPVFRIALGVFLVAAGLNGVLSRKLQHKFPQAACLPVGVASGFLAGAFVTGGPPVVLYLYSKVKDPREMKATVQIIFVTMLVARLTLIAFIGKGYTVPVLKLAAWVAPVCIPILLLGHILSKKGSAQAFKTVVYTLIAISGISLVVKASLPAGTPTPQTEKSEAATD